MYINNVIDKRYVIDKGFDTYKQYAIDKRYVIDEL